MSLKSMISRLRTSITSFFAERPVKNTILSTQYQTPVNEVASPGVEYLQRDFALDSLMLALRIRVTITESDIRECLLNLSAPEPAGCPPNRKPTKDCL